MEIFSADEIKGEISFCKGGNGWNRIGEKNIYTNVIFVIFALRFVWIFFVHIIFFMHPMGLVESWGF